MWFSKWFFPQYCLITMIEKWRRSVDGGGQAGPFLTHIQTMNYLIAKRHVYGFIKIPCTLLISI